jgi:hypothetical protein
VSVRHDRTSQSLSILDQPRSGRRSGVAGVVRRQSLWVCTRAQGKKRDRKIGPTKADERKAENIAEKINAALALGQYRHPSERKKPAPCTDALLRWHRTYRPTLKRTYEISTKGLIENHLAPHFKCRDLRQIREADVLAFARVEIDQGLAPGTIKNALGVPRRVY